MVRIAIAIVGIVGAMFLPNVHAVTVSPTATEIGA
jgi:hypothetical protein